jgi:hypothetical protein
VQHPPSASSADSRATALRVAVHFTLLPAAGFRGRAKLIVKVDPMPAAMPSMLYGYNGKPALLTTSSSVDTGMAPGEAGANSYMEIDCNIRQVRPAA